jgi:outer membrane protein assembly factor BamB
MSAARRPPVVGGGRVYTIDTTATVRAFDAQTGGQRWADQFGTERGNNASLFGGGVAYDNGRIYATNGLGFVAALDAPTAASSGRCGRAARCAALRRCRGDTHLRDEPGQPDLLAQGGRRHDQLVEAAALEIAGVFGTGSPGLRAGHGGRRLLVGRAQRLPLRERPPGVAGRAAADQHPHQRRVAVDIDADPVIDNGQVFALGQGGRMVALELISGQRMWELNIAGISTPWVAGDWVFVVTDDAKLIAIAAQTGKIRWINQLPRFLSGEGKRGQISYSGPVLAGGRLIVAGSNGVLINVDPATGNSRARPTVGGDQPAAGGRQLDALRARRRRPAARVPLSRSRRNAPGGLGRRHAASHRRHRRPSERRQIDPVQPPRRQALALVDDRPGVTRDRREGDGRACSGSSSG